MRRSAFELLTIRGTRTGIIVLGMLVFGFPIYWMLRGAVIDQATWLARPIVWVPSWDQVKFDAVGRLWEGEGLRVLRGLFNSFLIATFSAGMNVLYCGMAAFALAKMRPRCTALVTALLLVSVMVPFEGMMVSLFLVVAWIGLFNSYAGLVLPMAASSFNVLLLMRFFTALPDEIIEAARVDGAGWGRIFLTIALPLAAPAVATVAAISFLAGWESFTWPMLVTDPTSNFDVVQKVVAMQTRGTLAGGTDADYPRLMVAAILATVPMLVVFVFGQRYIVAGLTGGAVKA